MTPTVAQMRPQSRHYTDRALIFERFKEHLSSFDDFMKVHCVSSWKLMDAVFFSKKWYLPGSFFRNAPCQLKDAVALGTFVFSPSASLGTRSAILYHANYAE